MLLRCLRKLCSLLCKYFFCLEHTERKKDDVNLNVRKQFARVNLAEALRTSKLAADKGKYFLELDNSYDAYVCTYTYFCISAPDAIIPGSRL